MTNDNDSKNDKPKSKLSLPAIPEKAVVEAIVAKLPMLNPVKTLDVVRAELELYVSGKEYEDIRDRHSKGQLTSTLVTAYVAANCIKRILGGNPRAPS